MMMHSEMENRVQQKRSLQRTRRKKEQQKTTFLEILKMFFKIRQSYEQSRGG